MCCSSASMRTWWRQERFDRLSIQYEEQVRQVIGELQSLIDNGAEIEKRPEKAGL